MRGIRPEAVRRGLVWAAATFVWSCSSSTAIDSSGSDVASIVVTPPTSTIAVGAEVPLQATPQDASGKTVGGVSVLWSVQDSKIAKVSASGVVTGLAVGTTQVAANANGKSGIAAITVQKTPVASVVVLPKKIDGVNPGTKSPLTATAYDAAQNALSDRTITWTTSNEQVATVDANGVVTATGPGSATITAAAEGKTDAATITVTQAPVATVEVTPNPLTMSVSQSTQMTATPKDANGNALSGRAVTWSSSDPTVATIDNQGKLTAVAAGTTTITATSEGKSGTAAITISTSAVGSVSVQPPTPSVVQGTSVQLTAIVKDQFENVTNNRAVTWSSGATGIATVSQSGLVTGVGPGTAIITATSEGKSGTATVTVTPVPVGSIAISPPSASVTAGKTSQLTATTKDANGNPLTGRTITWSSSNANAATVSSTGLVTALAVGTTVITATSEGKSATANINVLSPILAVGTVTVSPTSPSVIAGQTAQMTATVKDISGTVVTDRAVDWSSSNLNVAAVSTSGVVGGVAPGTATITATVEGKSASTTVTVLPVPVGSVELAPTSPNVVIGTTQQLTITVKDLNGTVVTDRIVNWSSSSTSVATVSQAGVVNAIALGTTTITATSEGKSGTATVTVVPVPVGSVAVSPPTSSVLAGNSVQLSTTVKDQNGKTVTDRTVTWASSNDAVATVSASGKVVGVTPGTVTITATSEGKSGTASVTVLPVPVGTVTLSPNPASVVRGQTAPLTATVKDLNGTVVTDRTVTWSSSNESIATVSSSGVVSGVAIGTTTITATSEGKNGTATVNVTSTPVGSVTVTPGSASVATTQQTTLTATVKDANGNVIADHPVQWSSNNLAVATVSQSGVVTGVVPGTATITATADGKSGSSVITVTLLPVATVTVAPSPASAEVGYTTQLTATTKDGLGTVLTGRTITWSSGATNIATVSSTGLVTGVAPGTAVITAASEGKTGTSTVTVTIPAVASITLAPPSATLTPGTTATFTPTLKDSHGGTLTGRTVTWQSSAPGVATVNGSGVVTAVSEGTSTITATSEGKSATATVTVQAGAVATVVVGPSSPSVLVGTTQQLTATLKDASGNVLSGRTVTWQTDKPGVATVSASGLVTGVAVGSAVITATSEGKSGTVTVSVINAPVNTVTVTPNPLNVFVASTASMTATLKDANGNTLTGRPVTWQSSNTTVATVSASGVVTGGQPGTATISATSEGKTGTATVNVTLAPVSSVDVSPNSVTIQVGNTTQLSATLKDANGTALTGRTVTWSSDNTNSVTVNSTGLVTAKKPGSANVSATSEGKTGTAVVKVMK
jgi:uncharacterized protein YjdB